VKELAADVKKANSGGFAPLCVAARFKRLDIVRCLVNELGADVNQAAYCGSTPLLMAVDEGYVGLAGVGLAALLNLSIP
jgi:ankyrin repeat protein